MRDNGCFQGRYCFIVSPLNCINGFLRASTIVQIGKASVARVDTSWSGLNSEHYCTSRSSSTPTNWAKIRTHPANQPINAQRHTLRVISAGLFMILRCRHYNKASTLRGQKHVNAIMRGTECRNTQHQVSINYTTCVNMPSSSLIDPIRAKPSAPSHQGDWG